MISLNPVNENKMDFMVFSKKKRGHPIFKANVT